MSMDQDRIDRYAIVVAYAGFIIGVMWGYQLRGFYDRKDGES